MLLLKVEVGGRKRGRLGGVFVCVVEDVVVIEVVATLADEGREGRGEGGGRTARKVRGALNVGVAAAAAAPLLPPLSISRLASPVSPNFWN
jgi:hypothetical protein